MKKNLASLIEVAETMTASEFNLAPELPTLVTLDASLLATMNLLEFHNPAIGGGQSESIAMADGGTELHIAESIFILATALRGNLAAYYAVIRNSCPDRMAYQDINF